MRRLALCSRLRYRNPLLFVLAVLLVFSTPSISLKQPPTLNKVEGANMEYTFDVVILRGGRGLYGNILVRVG